jgi:hypothetical protein
VSEKHEVTVMAPVTMSVSVEQVVGYMTRRGWRRYDYRVSVLGHDGHNRRVIVREPLERVVLLLADCEGRQAVDVLTDIAKEPA